MLIPTDDGTRLVLGAILAILGAFAVVLLNTFLMGDLSRWNEKWRLLTTIVYTISTLAVVMVAIGLYLFITAIN